MMLRRFSYLLLILLSSTAAAEPSLTPHTAEYKIKISVLGGKLHTQLTQTESGYKAATSIQATGMSRIIARGAIRESSEFAASADGIRPNRFLSDDSLSKGGETVDFVFDWEASDINGTINGAEFRTDIDGIVHDRVSLQYGLMYDLINGVYKSDYALQDAEKFKPLSITNIGSKPVKVPFGSFEAIGIQHQAEGSSRITTLWCVEELDYLPVIIEQHRKGKLQMRAVLTAYSEQIT
jgi:hypothetical protein